MKMTTRSMVTSNENDAHRHEYSNNTVHGSLGNHDAHRQVRIQYPQRCDVSQELGDGSCCACGARSDGPEGSFPDRTGNRSGCCVHCSGRIC